MSDWIVAKGCRYAVALNTDLLVTDYSTNMAAVEGLALPTRSWLRIIDSDGQKTNHRPKPAIDADAGLCQPFPGRSPER